jgi:hypothetical protein
VSPADFEKSIEQLGKEILSLLPFKERLAELGRFYIGYDNIEQLKRQFRGLLDKQTSYASYR